MCSAFNPSKCTHTWSSGHPMLWRTGSSWGFGALLKGLTSVVDNSCRSRDSNPQPRVTIPTLYPLEPWMPQVFGHFSTFAELKPHTIEAKLARAPSSIAQVSATVKLGPWFQLFVVANTDLKSFQHDCFGLCSIRLTAISSLLVNGWHHLNTSCLCTHLS